MQKEIKNKIEELLKAMGFENFEIEVKELIDEPLTFNVKTPESQILIGEQGIHLKSLEHIIKHLVSKGKTTPITSFILDINGYRAERAKFIKQMAKEFCQKVIITKKPVSLPPLNAYERRLVHIELAAHPSVMTESQGDGEERRLVIKPYP